ncbi:T9SS type A sorting domain-containing protein [Psychroserpens sp. Hel_I_66]|uniref:T9SS type A sorting domain-containing protein n=1 Tax=Psychroserpens sp. Hel_I_66 TaxID=1250004 RepID=UPI0006481694|nr:T9SS type A sorting domain-containing protein [Psychroserpens sp. Hel_I_66]
MKTKLLTLMLFVFISNIIYSQTSTTDYVSGVADATFLTMNGTNMYVLGSENIYRIDTTLNDPTPTVIYTVENDFFLVNFTINNNLIYVALENYIQATDTFVGGKIISIDLNNLSNPAQDIYTTGEYISSITNNGSTLYITAETMLNPPEFEPFSTHLDEIDASIPNPTAQLIVNNVTNTSVVRGNIFDNNIIYLSSTDDNEILTIDVSQSSPDVNVLASSTFSRGLFKSGNELYLANGSLINKIDVTNPSAGPTSVAINTTYEDTNDGNLFFANFRDVVLVGNMIYATLQNQGKIVQAIDTTLSLNDFSNQLSSVFTYNNKDNIYINGLDNQIHNIKIYNLTGSEILTKSVTSNKNSIEIKQLSNGMYILNIDNKETFKFIK